MIKLRNLQPKPRTINGVDWRPRELQDFHADVVPGQSIRIHGRRWLGPMKVEFDAMFRVGDLAERGLPALHSPGYGQLRGPIVGIGKRSVLLQMGEKRVRLDLWKFAAVNSGETVLDDVDYDAVLAAG